MTTLAAEIAALGSSDEIVRERACRALFGRAQAGEPIGKAIPPLAVVLEQGSVLTWIAACHALRVAAARGAKLGRAYALAVRLVARPPKIADRSLVRELRNAAVGVATHKWLTGNTWAINTTLKNEPELRIGILVALREIAEASGKLAKPVMGEVVVLLGAKAPDVVEEASRTLRAFARAKPAQTVLVCKALSAVRGTAATRLRQELEGLA